jgi:hypothetical protein
MLKKNKILIRVFELNEKWKSLSIKYCFFLCFLLLFLFWLYLTLSDVYLNIPCFTHWCSASWHSSASLLLNVSETFQHILVMKQSFKASRFPEDSAAVIKNDEKVMKLFTCWNMKFPDYYFVLLHTWTIITVKGSNDESGTIRFALITKVKHSRLSCALLWLLKFDLAALEPWNSQKKELCAFFRCCSFIWSQ